MKSSAKILSKLYNASLLYELNKTLKRRMLFTWHVIKLTAHILKKCLFSQDAKVHDEQQSAKFIVCMFFRKLWAHENSEMQSGKCCHGDHMARKRHELAWERAQAIESSWNVGSIWHFILMTRPMHKAHFFLSNWASPLHTGKAAQQFISQASPLSL